MLKTVKLSELKPNPYRHFGTYEIQEDKIDSLLESITASGFWGETVIARKASTGYELAFGHHRWQAAKEFHKSHRRSQAKLEAAGISPDGEVQISIRKLDNDDMLKMMARENDEVYDSTAQQDIELVKASLEGIVAGEIHIPLNTGDKQSQVSDFIEGNGQPVDHSFSSVELSQYLGKPARKVGARIRPHWRIQEALGSLKLLKDEDALEPADYDGMTPRQAKSMNAAVRKAPEAAKREVVKVAKETAALGGRGSGHRAIEEATRTVIEAERTEEEPVTDISDVCRKIEREIEAMLSLKQEKIIKEIIKNQEWAELVDIFRVKSALKYLAVRANSLAKKLNAPESMKAPDLKLVEDEKRKTQ